MAPLLVITFLPVNPSCSGATTKSKLDSETFGSWIWTLIILSLNFFDKNQVIITDIDKKAYLSSLKLANHIVVTCDSTSMISEAAITGKPIYVAQMPPVKNNIRFQKFFEMFKKLNIIKDLDDKLEDWKYEKLNETDRISGYIKSKIKNYDIS